MAGDAFWRFSLAVYRRPGVAQACLALQDRCGLDVNLLLFCLFAARRGQVLTPRVLRQAMARATPIQRGIIAPLREARRALKRQAELADPALAAAAKKLRASILRHELAAEHFEQMAVAGLLRPARAGSVDTALNLRAYCTAARVPLARARRAGLARLESNWPESQPRKLTKKPHRRFSSSSRRRS